MHQVGVVIAIVLQLYMFLMFVRMVLSWVTMFAPGFTPRGALLVVFEAVFTLTDPPIRLFSRMLPDVRAGGVSFSLGFLAAWVALILLQQLNQAFLLR